MTYYLCGPITNGGELLGTPSVATNARAFDNAAAALRARGHHVVSPVEYARRVGWGCPYLQYMAHSQSVIETLAQVGGIVVMLPGWQASRGALMEVDCAVRFGVDVKELGEVLT